MTIKELLSEIKDQCTSALWSKGVQLSRQDAVSGESITDEEVTLQVLDRSLGRGVLVQLWPNDLDWNSNCQCPQDPCFHVIAATISLKQAQDRGDRLPQSKSASGKLIYRFIDDQGELKLRRFVSKEDQEHKLNGFLTSHQQQATLDFTPSQEDIEIDRILIQGGGLFNGKTLHKIAPFLCKASERVFLDQDPVEVSEEPLSIMVHITDEGHGIKLKARLDLDIQKSFMNNIGLKGQVLHPVQNSRLNPGEHKLLKNGWLIPPQDLQKAATELIPALRKRAKVIDQSTNMPQLVSEVPRLVMNLQDDGIRLTATPMIVYGDPVHAKIIGREFIVTGTKIPIRNHELEKKLTDRLMRQTGLDVGQHRSYLGSEAVKYVHSLNQGQMELTGPGKHAFLDHGTITPAVSLDEHSVDLSFTAGNGGTANPDAVLQAWERNESMVRLNEGGWATLPRDWLSKFGARILALTANRADKEPLPPYMAPSLAELASEMGVEMKTQLMKLGEKLNQEKQEIPKAQLPEDLRAELRPYQQDGVNWLSFLKENQIGALLADDMGLGKTLQTISILQEPSLVVAPTSLLSNWLAEIKKFRPSLKVCMYHGSQRKIPPSYDVLLTSYGILRQDIETLSRLTFQVTVLDEAQYIKNPDSQAARAAFKLSTKFRLALTGTPVENSLEDLWSQFHFINPGLLGSLEHFKNRYLSDYRKLNTLHHKINPFLLRRLKRDVAKDLPPKTEQLLYVELSEEEKLTYQAVQATSRQEVMNRLEQGGGVMEALELLLRLRQACCHPGLLPNTSAEDSAKLNSLMDKIDICLAEGHKSIIFSQWTSFLDLIEERLQLKNIESLRLDGSTRNRQKIVDEFQDDLGPKVLVMSLKAGGVGLNLTKADHVFIMDPWWNPATEAQAADRAHRIGQENPVMVYKLVAKDTVEEKIIELQEKKRALADITVGQTSAEMKLEKSDILQLLNDL